jgi:hypothetical protein
MKKPILTQKESVSKKIKVKLDHRTMVVINDISAFEIWKKKYPLAAIID